MHEDQLKKILLKRGWVTEESFQAGLMEASRRHLTPLIYFASLREVSARQLYMDLAEAFGVDYIDLKNIALPKELVNLLPEGLVLTHQVIAFGRDARRKRIKIATTDPDDIQTIQFIEKKLGTKVDVYLTDPDSIAITARLYHKTLEEKFQDLIVEAAQEVPLKPERLAELAQRLPMVKIVDVLLDYAIFQQASDIHIEPTEQDVIIRFRMDGILRDIMTFPVRLHPAITARIKVLAKLKLDEHRLPQDGRFRLETSNYRTAFRVSVFPTIDGEKIVLRLLDESARPLTLEQIGLLNYHQPVVQRNIHLPHGIIYVTGPTGSGKTTTQYTIINLINTPEVNISTIEDPIEYRILRVNQSQVNPKIGFTFAAGLRSLLRQDPNIMMVGEIRDQETAEIAAHAALTGHLVLTTLHTNDAVGAPLRLSEMGVPNFLIAATTNLIIAQRLVRKICTHCIFSFELTADDLARIQDVVSFQTILQAFQQVHEIEGRGQSLRNIRFFKGKGCSRCNHSGYKGRIGIFEVLEVTPQISEMIFQRESRNSLFAAAQSQGMITLIQDGFIKAKRGITSVEEVLRVTKE